MVITHLPPEPNPERITARAAIRSLGEHYQAFLAMNNLKGYPDEPEHTLRGDRVHDLLLIISTKPGLTIEEAKAYGFRLKHITQGVVKLTEGYLMVVRALGYSNWAEARHCAEVGDFIPNLWPYAKEVDVRDLLSPSGSIDTKELHQRLFGSKIRELLQANTLRNTSKKHSHHELGLHSKKERTVRYFQERSRLRKEILDRED